MSLEQFRTACHISKRKASELIRQGKVHGDKTGPFTCCYRVPKAGVVQYLILLEENPEKRNNGCRELISGKQFEIPLNMQPKLTCYYITVLSLWPDAMPVKDVAECLGYLSLTVRKWISEEFLSPVKVGTRHFILKTDLCTFLATERFRMIPLKSAEHVALEEKAMKALSSNR